MSDKKTNNKEEFKKIIRIAEADLDGSKRIEHALTSIRGVGWSYANAIRNVLGFENKKLSELSEEEIKKIKEVLESPEKFGIPMWMYNRRRDTKSGKDVHVISSDLELVNKMDIRRLKGLKTYRGVRHSYNYKVRGQRTRSRGANVRGRRGSTVGVVRKKLQPQKKKKDSGGAAPKKKK